MTIDKILTKKNIILIAVNVFLLIAFIVCLVISSSIRTSLRSQQAIRAWGGQSGERFAQLSVFFPESSGFNEEAVYGLRHEIENALVLASIDTPPGRTLYTDAWSAVTEVTVVSDRDAPTVKAIAVGGDFFMFHPLYLRDGNYISPDDVMKDRIVLDEELAWRLFGSVKLAGLEVTINSKPFIIAGVISRERDFASTKAYAAAFVQQDDFFSAPNTSGASMFISFDALMEMTEGEATISWYEIVLPDPITGFALRTLSEKITDQDAHIVENSARFSLSNSFAAIRSFGERSMQTEAIIYPYWENAARLVEDWLALLLVFALLFLVFPVICGIIYLIKLIKFGIGCGKKAIKKVIAEHDRKDYEKYLLKHSEDYDVDIYDVDNIIREVQDNDD